MSVRRAIRLLPDAPTGFSESRKTDVLTALADAGRCLDGTQPTAHEINAGVAGAQRMFEAAAVYVVKPVAQKSGCGAA